jgi:probable rRNA maturation factor
MILLDPDLAPPAPKATSAKRAVAPAAASKSPNFVLPSARTLARFLTQAQAAIPLKGQVTVLLTTDAAIRKLNRRFRGKNKATDVLSFPAGEIGAEGIAGDLAISVTTALGQAAEQGHSLSTEIKVLILHGLLHLAGYDHEADNGKMARRERLLRKRLGLAQSLIERAAANIHSLGRENTRIAQGEVRGGGRNPGLADPPARPSRRAGAKSKTHGLPSRGAHP